MAISPSVRLNVSGARGESQADILRRTGLYGVLPTDTDAEAVGKLNAVAQGYAEQAAASAALAEAAAGPTYPDTASGLAATTSGQSFAVDNGDGTVTIYLNNAGVAVAQRTLATTSALALPTAAASIGSTGPSNVQADLNARPTTTALAAGSGSGLVGYKLDHADAVPWALDARIQQSHILPGDFLAPEGGSANAQAALQLAFNASATIRRPLLINGIYRLDSALLVRSDTWIEGAGSLRANHAGNLLDNGETTVARVTMKDIRLEAQVALVDKAIDGNQWQNCRFDNLRFMSAGGKFNTAFFFENVAYWNSARDIEAEAAVNCFDLNDANNLYIENINWCRFTDIGMKKFINFSGPVSGLIGRMLSAEGVFNATTLITHNPSNSGIDLEFIRVEGHPGSGTTKFMDFNGAKGQRVVVPEAVFGLGGAVLTDEDGNFVVFKTAAGGIERMGTGQAVAPLTATDPNVNGAFAYNTVLSRLRAYIGSALSFFFTPAIDTLDMNGNPITEVSTLRLQDGVADPGTGAGLAILRVDSTDGDLYIRFADGTQRKLTTDAAPITVTGSRGGNAALASLLTALATEGRITDGTTA